MIDNKNNNATNGPNEEENKENTRKNIEDFSRITTKTSRGCITCITIIGQIEGHYVLPSQSKTTKYEHIMPQLVAIEESEDTDGLLLLLNTVGGDVEAGLAIAELISSMKKPTVTLVLGGGHSIGVPLAVSARKSFIVPSATMTIHPVRINGLVIGSPQSFNYFKEMQNRISTFIVEHSDISWELLNEYLFATDIMANDVGTILDGEQAVKDGLIGACGGLSDALDCLYELIAEYRAQNPGSGNNDNNNNQSQNTDN